jgi:hypothetical protein
MSTLDKDDEHLIATKIRLLEQVKDIDAELISRAKKREFEGLKQMIPEWDLSLECAYLDGFRTGVTWTRNYRPGGPWVQQPCPEGCSFFRKDMTRDQFNAYAALSQAKHDRWMAGWDEGKRHQDRLKEMSNGN